MAMVTQAVGSQLFVLQQIQQRKMRATLLKHGRSHIAQGVREHSRVAFEKWSLGNHFAVPFQLERLFSESIFILVIL